MLRPHLAAVAKIDQTPSLKYRLRQYFQLSSGSLFQALRDYGCSQADLVLALIRIGTRTARRIVESLIGKPITIGPACRFVYNFNKSRPTLLRQPVITHVDEAAYVRKGSRLEFCMREFKVGRTQDQLIRRGVRRGDIRRAVARGIVRIVQ